MNTIGVRLRELRQSAKLSQAKIAAIVGSRQSAVARFESGEAHVPAEVMIRYADYFDVSLDYIFGRTDKPQGKLYEGKMKIEKVYPEMDKFIEMCFDPGSPINERLKETLREMLKEGQECADIPLRLPFRMYLLRSCRLTKVTISA